MFPQLTMNVFLLGGTSEVATALGCSKQQIHALRKLPNFPQPVHTVAASPLWNLDEIHSFKSTWKRRTKKV